MDTAHVMAAVTDRDRVTGGVTDTVRVMAVGRAMATVLGKTVIPVPALVWAIAAIAVTAVAHGTVAVAPVLVWVIAVTVVTVPTMVVVTGMDVAPGMKTAAPVLVWVTAVTVVTDPDRAMDQAPVMARARASDTSPATSTCLKIVWGDV